MSREKRGPRLKTLDTHFINPVSPEKAKMSVWDAMTLSDVKKGQWAEAQEWIARWDAQKALRAFYDKQVDEKKRAKDFSWAKAEGDFQSMVNGIKLYDKEY